MGTYPLISKLLQIFETISVLTATNKQSFSALKLLKTFLRTTMREKSLRGLAHLYINRNINLDCDAVINEFGQKKKKKT